MSSKYVEISFIYGLSFFILGVVTSLQERRESRFRLAKSLWALSAFAYLHAFADWGAHFIPLQANPEDSRLLGVLFGIKTVASAVSFGFLTYFGLKLLNGDLTSPRNSWASAISLTITGFWLAAFMAYPVITGEKDLADWFRLSETWSRYLLGLPSSVLTGVALLRQTEELRLNKLEGHVRILYLASICFFIYAVAAGLVVPRQSFLPASVLNAEAFLSTFGIPIEVVRSVAGLGIMFFMVQLLGIFKVEMNRRLRQAEAESAMLRERQRISRELHDSILQTLYGAGLGLRQAISVIKTEPDQAVGIACSVMTELDRAIKDLRRSILDLQVVPLSIVDFLDSVHSLTRRVGELSGLQVNVHIEGFSGDAHNPLPPRVSSRTQEMILNLVRESLSNVVRHANARSADVLLAYEDGTIILRVTDRGRGFDVNRALTTLSDDSTGQGIRNMRQRVEQACGLFQVVSAPGRGTDVLIHLPTVACSDLLDIASVDTVAR